MKKKLLLFIFLLMICCTNTYAFDKTETIYNNLNYNGKVTKKVINNHLYNINNDSIEDNSILENIINLNGNEKYNYSNNKLTWENKGNEIYYQGIVNKEDPIKFNIKYYLNDKKINPNKIIGKKGNIKIKINITNNSFNKKYNVYNPFVVTMGTIISNDKNYNIKVTNGSIISTGTNSFVVGLSSPGINYNINNDLLNDLDNITISYNTDSFSMKNIYFVATPKILSKVDIDKLNKIESLSSSISLLKTNMDKIDNGSKELLNGSMELYKGGSELNEGIKKIDGVINELDNGIINLDDGIKIISSEVSKLNKELSSKFTEETISNLNLLVSYDKKFYDIKNDYYKEYSFGYLKDTSFVSLTLLHLNHTLSDEEYKNLVSVKLTYETQSDMVELLANNYLAVNNLLELANKLELINELDINLNSISDGIGSIRYGLNETNRGSDKLVEGSDKLNNGLLEFTNGFNTLSNGITTINSEGISKLYEYSNIINGYLKQVKNMTKASKEYNGYTSNNSKDTVFIYKVKSVK